MTINNIKGETNAQGQNCAGHDPAHFVRAIQGQVQEPAPGNAPITNMDNQSTTTTTTTPTIPIQIGRAHV